MSDRSHTHEIEHEHEDDGGLLWEQCVLRSMLLAIAGLPVASVVTSLDDLRRYIRIKRI